MSVLRFCSGIYAAFVASAFFFYLFSSGIAEARMSIEYNIDYQGGDYDNFYTATSDHGSCSQACERDSRCRAFTFVLSNSHRKSRCWLKYSVTKRKFGKGMISGIKHQNKAQNQDQSVPDYSELSPRERRKAMRAEKRRKRREEKALRREQRRIERTRRREEAKKKQALRQRRNWYSGKYSHRHKAPFPEYNRFCSNLNDSAGFIRCFDAIKHDVSYKYMHHAKGLLDARVNPNYECPRYADIITQIVTLARHGKNQEGYSIYRDLKKSKSYITNDCSVIARVVGHYIGDLPEWAGCTGDPMSPDHFRNCIESEGFKKHKYSQIPKHEWSSILKACVGQRHKNSSIYRKYISMTRKAVIDKNKLPAISRFKRQYKKSRIDELPQPDCQYLLARATDVLGEDNFSIKKNSGLFKLKKAKYFKNASCLEASPEDSTEIRQCFTSYTGYGGSVKNGNCQYLTQRYTHILKEAGIENHQLKSRLPSCSQFATMYNSKWKECVGYGNMSAKKHFTRCLNGYGASYLANIASRPARNPDALLHIYATGVKDATPDGRLPESYRNLDHSSVRKLASNWLVPPLSIEDKALLQLTSSAPSLLSRLKSKIFGSKNGHKQKPKYAANPDRCSVLADHPDDPRRETAGVPDNKLQFEDALEACMTAVEKHSDAPRYKFILGRLVYLAGHHEKATSFLADAVDADYGPAAFYLGEMFLNGSGVEADEQRALAFYEQAAKSDFKPALKIVSSYSGDHTGGKAAFSEDGSSKGELNLSKFHYKNVMRYIYYGEFEKLNSNGRKASKHHMSVLGEAYIETCPGMIDPGLKNAMVHSRISRINPNKALGSFLKDMMDLKRGGVQNYAGKLADRQMSIDYAKRDLNMIINKQGCDGRQVERLLANMKSYFLGGNPNRQGLDQLLAADQESQRDQNIKAACVLKLKDNNVAPVENSRYSTACECVTREIGRAGIKVGDKKHLAGYFSGILIKNLAKKYEAGFAVSIMSKCLKNMVLDDGFNEPFPTYWAYSSINKTLVEQNKATHPEDSRNEVLACKYMVGNEAKAKRYWYNPGDGRKRGMRDTDGKAVMRTAVKCPPHYEK